MFSVQVVQEVRYNVEKVWEVINHQPYQKKTNSKKMGRATICGKGKTFVEG